MVLVLDGRGPFINGDLKGDAALVEELPLPFAFCKRREQAGTDGRLLEGTDGAICWLCSRACNTRTGLTGCVVKAIFTLPTIGLSVKGERKGVFNLSCCWL